MDTAFYDEVTHASEEHVWWINSRIRNASSNIKHKSFWMSCNPDPDAWLMKYVEWYLYPEGHPKEGLPNPERNGVGRYMFRKDGKIYFSDTAEDLVKKYGVKGLPLGAKGQIEPISITVLLGTVD